MEINNLLVSPNVYIAPIKIVKQSEEFSATKISEGAQLEWKGSPKNMDNKLHTICSYMAMFPPSVPNHFIKKYSKIGDLVLDTFSGRGTTVLEACMEGRIGIGNDLSPLAFLLTKTKCNVPLKSTVIRRIIQLQREFTKNEYKIDISNEEPNIRMIFHDHTLRQLVFLKKELEWKKSNVDAFVATLVEGILHGGSEGYLSLSMPNTFSMAPNYVKKNIAQHGLIKPKRETFDLLLRKLERCYQRPWQKGIAYRQDARNIKNIKDSCIDLIITSPPYLRVIKYGKFNWIRVWFLGEDCDDVDQSLFFSQSLNRYCEFMTEILKEMQRVLKPKAKAVLVIGDVKDRFSSRVDNLAEHVWERCAHPLGFKLVEPIIEDVISDENKVSKIWGKKRGNATKIDRILVLKKD